MPYFDFFWTPGRIEHFGEHGITQDEFEDVVMAQWTVEDSRSSDRIIAIGYVDGRRIACVYEMLDELTVYPITAYEV